MAEVFFYAILLYVFYRFVTGFLIPVYRTSKLFKQQFGNMRSTAQPAADPQQEAGRKKSSGNPASTHPPSGDYIDFEEIK